MLTPIPPRPTEKKENGYEAERGHCFSLPQAGMVPVSPMQDGDILTTHGPQRNLVLLHPSTCPTTGSGVGIIALGSLRGMVVSTSFFMEPAGLLTFIDSRLSIKRGLFRQE